MSRNLRHIVTISTIGLLSFGGVAAAATGTSSLPFLDGPAPHVTVPESTTTTTTTIATTTAPTTTAAQTAGASTAEDSAICATAANHGEAVSSVATDKSTVGAEHGAAVSEMAQSDCGKDAETTVDDGTEATDETSDDEDCANATNHGEAVSKVAKDKSTVGAEHGAAVSAMAKSDCGKQD